MFFLFHKCLSQQPFIHLPESDFFHTGFCHHGDLHQDPFSGFDGHGTKFLSLADRRGDGFLQLNIRRHQAFLAFFDDFTKYLSDIGALERPQTQEAWYGHLFEFAKDKVEDRHMFSE